MQYFRCNFGKAAACANFETLHAENKGLVLYAFRGDLSAKTAQTLSADRNYNSFGIGQGGKLC